MWKHGSRASQADFVPGNCVFFFWPIHGFPEGPAVVSPNLELSQNQQLHGGCFSKTLKVRRMSFYQAKRKKISVERKDRHT